MCSPVTWVGIRAGSWLTGLDGQADATGCVDGGRAVAVDAGDVAQFYAAD